MTRLPQSPVTAALPLVLLLAASAPAQPTLPECDFDEPGWTVACTTLGAEPQPDDPREREAAPGEPASTTDDPVFPRPPGPDDRAEPIPPGPDDPGNRVEPGPVGPGPEENDDPGPPSVSPDDQRAWWLWWWWFPLLSILSLILATIALFVALWRRRHEERPRREPPIPEPLPSRGERYPSEAAGVAGAVVPVPPDDSGTEFPSPLIAFFEARSEELRRVLCTLARMGVAWRRAEPDLARAYVRRIETHPFYKGGQVLFDLLEWEDFMLDGEAAVADSGEVRLFIARIADALGLPAPDAVVAGDLPPLEPGFYLYRDVVLGSLAATMLRFPDAAGSS